jgi:hypothetical protein
MPDEPFALSTVPPAPPADADYDAICAAVTATERGRWFLDEFARRNRNSDTAQVLAAITRMETAVVGERNQRAVQDANQKVRIELLEIARAVAQTRAEVAERHPEPSHAPAEAASNVTASAERLRQIAWTLRACGIDLPITDQIGQIAEAILSANVLAGIDNRRAQKLTEALHYLEHRIDLMLDSRLPAESNHVAAAATVPAPPPSATHTEPPANDQQPDHDPDRDATALAEAVLATIINSEANPDDDDALAPPSLPEQAAAAHVPPPPALTTDAQASATNASEATVAEQTVSQAPADEQSLAEQSAIEPATTETITAEPPTTEPIIATAADEAAEATPSLAAPAPEENAASPEANHADEPEPASADESQPPQPIRLVTPSLYLDPPPVGARPDARGTPPPARHNAIEIQRERVEIEVVPLIAASAGGARAAPAIMQRTVPEFVGLELSPPPIRPAVIATPPAEPHSAEALATKPAANQNLTTEDATRSALHDATPAHETTPIDAPPTIDEMLNRPAPTIAAPVEAMPVYTAPVDTTPVVVAPIPVRRPPTPSTADAIAMQVERDLNALTGIAARTDRPADFLNFLPPIATPGAPLASPVKAQLSTALAAIETELFAGAALTATQPAPAVAAKPRPSLITSGPLAALMAMSEEEQIALFS